MKNDIYSFHIKGEIVNPYDYFLSIPIYNKDNSDLIMEKYGNIFIPCISDIMYTISRKIYSNHKISDESFILFLNPKYWFSLYEDNFINLSSIIKRDFYSITRNDFPDIEKYIVKIISFKANIYNINDINDIKINFEFSFLDKLDKQVYCISNYILYRELFSLV